MSRHPDVLEIVSIFAALFVAVGENFAFERREYTHNLAALMNTHLLAHS